MANLTRAEKQAYEGAKIFYNCFLPIVLGLTTIILLGNHHLSQNIYLDIINAGLAIIMYLISRKFYIKCNRIDTAVMRGIPSNNQNPSQSMNSSQQTNELHQQELQTQQQIKMAEQQTPLSPYNSTQQQQTGSKPKNHTCSHCNLTVPYRSRHCFKCQTCIERYDHHCFWIGNCVGAHNHKQFYLFLLMQTIGNILNQRCVSTLAPTIWTYFPYQSAGSYEVVIYIAYFCLWLMSWGFIMFTGYLLLYHTMLVCSNMTTWEHMRRQKITYLNYLPKGYNLFSKGLTHNIKQFFRKENIGRDYQECIIAYSDVPNLDIPFNIIDNQYYSCC